jgi:hypothetical protein
LNPWEVFTFFFLKSLGSLQEGTQPFFNSEWLVSGEGEAEDGGNGDVSMRGESRNVSGLIKSKLNESIMSFFGGTKAKKTSDEATQQAMRLLMESRIDISRILVLVFTKVLD